MRGYRNLRNSDSLDLIADVNRVLTTHRLEIKEDHFSKKIFGEAIGRAEIVCRQYLLARVAGLNLNRALLHTLGKPDSAVVFYLPPEWRVVIQKKGFKIASLRTSLMWRAFIGILLADGVLTIVKNIFKGIAVPGKPPQQLGRYAYFDNLGAGNLPQPGPDGRSHDIITWYMQWPDRVGNLDTVCHGVVNADRRAVRGTPIVPVEDPVPPLVRSTAIARFALWSLGAILIAGWDYLRGHWWHALLLKESALAAQVRMQDSELLAKDYLFHNSNWIYRPLWTYEAEKRGARITFYFYSTNCEAFKRPGGYPPLSYGWQAINWPHIVVWDEYQADFVRRISGNNARILVSGQIWFTTSAKEISKFDGQSIAVFDVAPNRSSRYRTLGTELEYYIPETSMSFIGSIQQAAEDTGCRILWKRKRSIGTNTHPRYKFFVDRLSGSGNIVAVDPDISAYRVIEASTHVVSMPFTSTALIARELGKPTCYYDPTGLVQKDDRAAHGIEIINSPAELTRWLSKAASSAKSS
jgi:polysaccharide biosynthesis PFTS motif protein